MEKHGGVNKYMDTAGETVAAFSKHFGPTHFHTVDKLCDFANVQVTPRGGAGHIGHTRRVATFGRGEVRYRR